MNKMTQANRQGWDGLAETHYKNYHIDTLLAGQPLLDELIRILDGHPFRNVLVNEAGETSPNTIQGSYFRKEVWQYDRLGDYTDPELTIPVNSYEWAWTMGEVITAFCEAGIEDRLLA